MLTYTASLILTGFIEVEGPWGKVLSLEGYKGKPMLLGPLSTHSWTQVLVRIAAVAQFKLVSTLVIQSHHNFPNQSLNRESFFLSLNHHTFTRCLSNRSKLVAVSVTVSSMLLYVTPKSFDF